MNVLHLCQLLPQIRDTEEEASVRDGEQPLPDTPLDQ